MEKMLICVLNVECGLGIGMVLHCAHLAKLNYISKNFLHCMFPLQRVTREILGRFEGRREAATS